MVEDVKNSTDSKGNSESKGKVKIIKIRDSEAGGLPSIKNEEFFHGFVPSLQTQNLLVNIGDFLVRQGAKKEGKHSSKEKFLISVRIKISDKPTGPPENLTELNAKERAAVEAAINLENERLAEEVLHVPIKYSRRARLHYVHTFGFRLASGLIEYHRRHEHPIDNHGTTIMRPIKRASWQLNHEQISRTKKLGDGAFGDVFMGHLRSGILGRIPVAVKTINGTISDSENEKLFQEAMLMKSLKHLNIIHLVGVASNEDPLMVVMEFASGGSVLDLVKQKAPPPSLYHRVYYCYGAAKGMAYLESKKIIHRDIAARNVLVGSDGEAKISDFGLSLAGSFKKEKTLNKVPVRYLAPETLHSAVYTHKSDVWTYGVYVWEVFHDGAEPFEGFERNADVKAYVKKGGRLSNTCQEFPLFLWELVLDRCWKQLPDERPKFFEIRDIIEEQLDDLKPSANLVLYDGVDATAPAVDISALYKIEMTYSEVIAIPITSTGRSFYLEVTALTTNTALKQDFQAIATDIVQSSACGALVRAAGMARYFPKVTLDAAPEGCIHIIRTVDLNNDKNANLRLEWVDEHETTLVYKGLSMTPATKLVTLRAETAYNEKNIIIQHKNPMTLDFGFTYNEGETAVTYNSISPKQTTMFITGDCYSARPIGATENVERGYMFGHYTKANLPKSLTITEDECYQFLLSYSCTGTACTGMYGTVEDATKR